MKRILWITNTIFPYPAEKLGIKKTVLGGWLMGLAYRLSEEKDIELAIATVYKGKEILEFKDKNITYYLIPGLPATKYRKSMENSWKEINKRFNPNLVHINGTEFTHGLAFQRACPDVKNVVSIQGLVSVYSKVYYANIPMKHILKNITIRDIIKKSSIISGKKSFEKRGKYEIETLKRANAISGRTIWDFANGNAINPDVKYYSSKRILREAFYNSAQWQVDKMKKHTIFCSQGNYPIKGLHFMIEALALIKRKYPDVKLNIAGYSIIGKDFKSRLNMTGYGKYIESLIKKHGLENNVEFTGLLNEKQMAERLLQSNVFVQSSAIENSPNSLGEAMYIGTPCVASNVGGTSDMLEDKKEGFLYPYTEPAILAQHVMRLFEDDELAAKLGEAARNVAKKNHDKEKNYQDTLNMYKDILYNWEK